MKLKSTGWLIVICLLTVFAAQTLALADDAAQAAAGSSQNSGEVKWCHKLGRGLLNMVSSPIEVVRQIHLTTQKETLLRGWTVGLVKGVGYGIARLGNGAVDTLTFPFKWPDANRAPLMQPEYVWDNTDIKYV